MQATPTYAQPSNRDGGNMRIASGATFVMTGGTISGGKAGNNGDSIYVDGGISITGGSVDGEIYFAGGAGVISAPTTVSGPVVFANKTNIQETLNGVSTSADKQGTYSEIANVLGKGGQVLIGHYHCLECGTVCCTKHKNVSFTPITQASIDAANRAMPTTTGNYYVAEDCNYYNQGNMNSADITVNICLNGHTVGCTNTSATGGRMYSLNNSATKNCTLGITDCSAEETGAVVRNFVEDSTAQGTTIWVNKPDNTFNLYRGTIDASNVYLKRPNIFGTVLALTNGNANIYGGTLIGSTCEITAEAKGVEGGSTIYASGASTINVYGGTIKDGKVISNVAGQEVKGGNIFITGTSVLNIHGGVISGGEAVDGGNIATADKAELNIYGGVIENGRAYYTETKDNEFWGGNGGNIWITGKATMSGGTIQNGIAFNKDGGNLAVGMTNSDFTMTGGTIKNGASHYSYRGNVSVYKAGAKFTMTGGEITYDTDFKLDADDEAILKSEIKNSKGVVKLTKGHDYKGGIYVTVTSAIVNISGNAMIYGCGTHDIYLTSDALITIGELTEGADIGVSMNKPGVFSNTGKDYISYIRSNDSNYIVVVSDNGLKLENVIK